VLNLVPGLLWREVIIKTQEVENIACSFPGIAVPVLLLASKDLKAGTQITTVMMFFEGTGAHPSTIQSRVATKHLDDILSLAPGPNTPTARMQAPLMASRSHVITPTQ